MSRNDILKALEPDVATLLRYQIIDTKDHLETVEEDLVEAEAILILLNENCLNNLTVDTILKRKRDRLRVVKSTLEDDISRYEQQIKEMEEKELPVKNLMI